MTDQTEKLETADELKEYELWSMALKKAGKWQAKWEERADAVVDRYLDERGSDGETHASKLNILWSNTETAKPMLYSALPKPNITRRHKDRDPLGIHASRILERAAEFALDDYDFDEVGQALAEDYLLPGRCIARVDYKPVYGEETRDRIPLTRHGDETAPEFYDEDNGQVETAKVQFDEDGSPFTETDPFRPVLDERALCRYVYYKDFRHGPARKWKDVPWVAFRETMGRKQLVKRFGKEIGNKVPLNKAPKSDNDEDVPEQFKKADVWEIWDKESGQCVWICLEYRGVLDKKEPPLKFKNFFPCPKPRYAVKANKSLLPTPEFCLYQDQADELDKVTGRIDAITESLKVVGVYAADAEGIEQMLDKGSENKLIPIKDWAMFAERGGLEGAVSWWPVEKVMVVLKGLYETRTQIKQELFELSGFSDIVRGQSDPNETATAQNIKGQFVGKRLGQKAKDIANLIRDLVRLKVEIIAEHFSPETLENMTGLEVTPEVMDLIRNDTLRTFRIDIETDSTVEPDQQEEKQSRIEFLTAISDYLKEALPVAQQFPEMGPLLGEFLLFGVRGFKQGRELEQQIDQTMEQLNQSRQQAQQGQGEGQGQDLEQAQTQQEMEIDAAEFQAEQKRKGEMHQLDVQKKVQDIQKGALR